MPARTHSPPSPDVELLRWKGCPSWPRALADLRAAMSEAGLDAQAVRIRDVESDGEARRLGFVGSPTIRVDGRDVVPPGPDAQPALTCRLYTRRDGRPSPLPDPAAVRAALAGAARA
jgi:hypothetical protein